MLFFLSALCIPLASMVSGEKLAVSLIENLLYEISQFSLVALKIVSLFLAFNSLIIMYFGVDLFEFILFNIH